MADKLHSFHNPTFLRSTWTAGDARNITAFAGRSNAGKSSVLNALCGGRFARTARTPGRTRMVNLFSLRNGCVLADLPGYGYAVGAHGEQEEWAQKLTAFMHDPAVIGAVLVVDCRRGLNDRDISFIQLCGSRPLLVLMNKSDKLGKSALNSCLKTAKEELAQLSPQAQLLPFSALKKSGVEDAAEIISSFWDT